MNLENNYPKQIEDMKKVKDFYLEQLEKNKQSKCTKCVCYTLCPIWFLPLCLSNMCFICVGKSVTPIQSYDAEKCCFCCYEYDI